MNVNHLFKRLMMACVILLTLLHWHLSLAAPSLKYQITGIDNPEKKNVISRLKIEQKNVASPLTQTGIDHLYKEAAENAKAALAPYGYFKAKVRVQLKHTGSDTWLLDINIIPGPLMKVNQFSLTIQGAGKNNPALLKVVKNFPIKQGDTLNTEDYDEGKSKLLNTAVENGFLDAKYTTSKIFVDVATNRSKIELVLNTGPQYYFGAVHFNQSFFDQGFLQRFVRFKPGDDYSSEKLLKLQQDLSSTQFFSSVSVVPEKESARHNYVPVNIDLTPSKAKRYNFGVGYGTDTGPRVTASADWRHLTNTGHHMKTSVQLAEEDSTLELRYVIPGENPLIDQYYFGASAQHQTPNDSKGNTQKLTYGFIDSFHGWRRTVSFSYQWDQYSIRKGPREYSNLFLPSVTLSKSDVDNPIFPRRAKQLSFTIRGSAEPLLSSTNFIQGIAGGKFIFSPTEKSRMIIRGNFGVTGINDIEKLPLSLQFFAGGTDSIRGYDYQELGPGRYLYVGSVEFQHQVKGNWYGAVFVDAGNAVNSFNNPENHTVGKKQANINLSELVKVSAGIGVVYASPVGPLEVTLAKPITDSHKKVRLQFNIGTTL